MLKHASKPRTFLAKKRYGSPDPGEVGQAGADWWLVLVKKRWEDFLAGLLGPKPLSLHRILYSDVRTIYCQIVREKVRVVSKETHCQLSSAILLCGSPAVKTTATPVPSFCVQKPTVGFIACRDTFGGFSQCPLCSGVYVSSHFTTWTVCAL